MIFGLTGNFSQFQLGGQFRMSMRKVVLLPQILTLLLMAIGLPWAAAAQERKKEEGAKNVKVVNTPSVNVANTANVNVTNTPSVQISGTAAVAVKNDKSAPVITRSADEAEPFVLQSQNSVTPFNVTLPSTTANGAKVKTVVIEFVTSDCDATPGTTILGAARLGTFFAGNLVIYALPSGPPLAFSNASEFVSAQKTLIFADPGATLEYGFSGGGGTCQVVFSGHLIPL